MNADAVTVQLNGEPHAVPAGQPLLDLLADLGLPPQAVLVELNGVARFRDDWPAVRLGDGDQLEIIRVVAGG